MNSEESIKDQFQGDLKSDLLPDHMTQKYILHGTCFAIDDPSYFELKREISNNFDIHPNEVVMVGSGKLGFSISPTKLFRDFGDHSDIDVAVISERLFDKVWRLVFQHDRDGGIWEKRSQFRKYLYRGWVRPDHLPGEIEFSKQWWKFFSDLNKSRKFGSYSIKAGVYKNWYFLEQYHAACVETCKKGLHEHDSGK